MNGARPAFRLLAAVLLTAAVITTSGCGSDDGSGGDLLVSAATSLKTAFTSYGEEFDDADAQFSFAGSDELAAQIRSGAKPDVFASANTKLPDALFADGLVEKPQVFAANRLVLAVPAGTTRRCRSIDDLSASQGVTIAIGAAERADRRVHAQGARPPRCVRPAHAILANVRSNEPDVGGIAAKLGQRRRRRGLSLRHRRQRAERPPEGDRAAGRAAAAASTTASRSSRARRIARRRGRSSPAC